MTNQNPILNPDERSRLIEILRALPDQLTKLSESLSRPQLATPAIPAAWSVAQVIHHLADAHMNSYIRTKRILAENMPEQRPFSQENWVDMPDETITSVETSLMILRGVHERWVTLFENLDEEDWGRTGRFRSDGSDMTIAYLLNSYANHSLLHLQQIEETIKAQSA